MSRPLVYNDLCFSRDTEVVLGGPLPGSVPAEISVSWQWLPPWRLEWPLLGNTPAEDPGSELALRERGMAGTPGDPEEQAGFVKSTVLRQGEWGHELFSRLGLSVKQVLWVRLPRAINRCALIKGFQAYRRLKGRWARRSWAGWVSAGLV